MTSDEAICNDIDTVLESLTASFEKDWQAAPRAFRNYVEKEVAVWWWAQGQKVANLAHTADLKEMRRLMKEKGLI
jgi:hypothetical protein